MQKSAWPQAMRFSSGLKLPGKEHAVTIEK